MNTTEFQKRRRNLMRMMGEDSIAILPNAPVRMRNRDVEFPAGTYKMRVVHGARCARGPD